jgi:uncharacterized membrane protein YdbT with pleckstrin-like domain
MRTFELGENEKVIAVFRKHQFYLWISAIKYVVLALLPILASSFIGNMLGDFSDIATSIYIAFVIILWIGFFIEWTDFMLDTWILTNQRLVDVEQLGLFNRRVSTLSLDRIQDITIEESGIVHTALGIGTVFIQTAGTEDEFRIWGMKYPAQVKDTIMQAYQTGKSELFQQIHELS